MLKLASYDIVFQEVPGEVTLALNLSNCPNRCMGCHSPHLWHDVGIELNESSLVELLERYGGSITCLCFMGGDREPNEIERLIEFLKKSEYGNLKIAWYSGKSELPSGITLDYFDYIKLGPYIEIYGGLDSPTTNQRFYEIENGELINRTNSFTKKS